MFAADEQLKLLSVSVFIVLLQFLVHKAHSLDLFSISNDSGFSKRQLVQRDSAFERVRIEQTMELRASTQHSVVGSLSRIRICLPFSLIYRM